MAEIPWLMLVMLGPVVLGGALVYMRLFGNQPFLPLRNGGATRPPEKAASTTKVPTPVTSRDGTKPAV